MEFDCLVDAAGKNPTRGFITNYTCSNGDKTFNFLCDVPNSTGSGDTVFTSPSCVFPTAGGETGYYGPGILVYFGNTNTSYGITVKVEHSYSATKYDSSGNNPDISDYTNLISFDCGNPTYIYTPGLAIYVGGNQQDKLDPKKAYGGSQDVIHDPDDTNPNHYTCTSHPYPYPPISLSHTVKLGTHSGKNHDELHCKLINGNNIGLRCVGNITIVKQ